MDKEAEQKMLEYMVALEKTNKQLGKSLKLCVEFLTAMQIPTGYWKTIICQARQSDPNALHNSSFHLSPTNIPQGGYF